MGGLGMTPFRSLRMQAICAEGSGRCLNKPVPLASAYQVLGVAMLDGCLKDPSHSVWGSGHEALRNRDLVAFRAPTDGEGAPPISDCLSRFVVSRYCKLLEESTPNFCAAGPEVLNAARLVYNNDTTQAFEPLERAKARVVATSRQESKHFWTVYVRPMAADGGGQQELLPGHYLAVLADVHAGEQLPWKLRVLDCAAPHAERQRMHDVVRADLACFYKLLGSSTGPMQLPPMEDMQLTATTQPHDGTEDGEGDCPGVDDSPALTQLLRADCIIFVLFMGRLWAADSVLEFNQADVVRCDVRLRLFIDIVAERVTCQMWSDLFSAWGPPDASPNETPNETCSKPRRKAKSRLPPSNTGYIAAIQASPLTSTSPKTTRDDVRAVDSDVCAIQCDACGKYRYVSRATVEEFGRSDKQWFCRMNSQHPTDAPCAAPEEDFELDGLDWFGGDDDDDDSTAALAAALVAVTGGDIACRGGCDATDTTPDAPGAASRAVDGAVAESVAKSVRLRLRGYGPAPGEEDDPLNDDDNALRWWWGDEQLDFFCQLMSCGDERAGALVPSTAHPAAHLPVRKRHKATAQIAGPVDTDWRGAGIHVAAGQCTEPPEAGARPAGDSQTAGPTYSQPPTPDEPPLTSCSGGEAQPSTTVGGSTGQAAVASGQSTAVVRWQSRWQSVVDELVSWPPVRFRVALRRARESDLGYGDVTLIGIPSNGALLSYNLAYHILPENFFDDVSTEPSDSEARAEELEQQEELAALSGSGSDSPFGSVHDLDISDEDF